MLTWLRKVLSRAFRRGAATGRPTEYTTTVTERIAADEETGLVRYVRVETHTSSDGPKVTGRIARHSRPVTPDTPRDEAVSSSIAYATVLPTPKESTYYSLIGEGDPPTRGSSSIQVFEDQSKIESFSMNPPKRN